MFTAKDLSDLEKDPEFQALKASDPTRADKLVRFAARSAVKSGLKSTSPEIKTFFERNLSAVKTPELPGFQSEAKRSFLQSDVGTIGGTLVGAQMPTPEGPPSPAMQRIETAYKGGILPAAKQTGAELFGAGKAAGKAAARGLYGAVTSPIKTTSDVIRGGVDVLGTEIQSGGIGTRSAVGAALGILPDIVVAGATGFGAGKLASKGLAKALPSLARTAAPVAGALAPTVPDYLIPYTAAQMRGATPEQAELAGLFGSAVGVPFGLYGAAQGVRGAMRPAAAPARSVAAPKPPAQPALPAGPPVLALPAQTPSTIAARQAAAERALYGQAAPPTPPPPRVISTQAELEAITPPRAPAPIEDIPALRANTEAAQQSYDALLASRAPLTAARQAQIQQAQQNLISARELEMNTIRSATTPAATAEQVINVPPGGFSIPDIINVPPGGFATTRPQPLALPAGQTAIPQTNIPAGFSPAAMEGQFAPPPSGLMSRPPEPTPPLQLPAITPSTMAQRQAATEQALYGQIAPPAPMGPRIIGSEAELAAATRMPPPAAPQDIPNLMAQRQAAEKAYNDLVTSKAPLTNTRKAAIEQARQTLTDARQAEMSAIQAMQQSGLPIPPPTPRPKKKALGPAPRPVAESEAVQAIRRLIADEGGAVTPVGALGVIANPVAAGGYLVKAMSRGAKSFYDLLNALVQTEGYGKVARGTAAVGDFINQLNIPMAGPISNARDRGLKMYMDTLYAKANTPWPTLNAALDGVRRLFNGRFGVPPEMMMIEEAARKDAIAEEKKLLDYARKVQQTVGDDDVVMRQLHNDITDANYAGTDPLVLEGKAISEAAGVALNKVGALSDEALKRWGGSYLPREYMKILLRDPESIGLLKFLRSFQDDPTLSGYYHRGKTEEVPASQVAAKLANGEGWEIIDPAYKGGKAIPTGVTVNVRGSQVGPRLASGQKWQITDPAYSAGQPIPANAWVEMQRPFTKGERAGETVKMWRDWTKAERESWGELTDVPRALLKQAADLRREIENGNILDGIRTGGNKEGRFAYDAASIGIKGPKSERPAQYVDPGTGQTYRYIGDDVRKGGPIKKYGNLSDHYVRDDVYSYIKTMNEFGNLKSRSNFVKRVLGINWWKEMQTIGNTRYFVNNFFVGMPTLELAGGSIADLPMAVRRLAQDDSLVQQLRARGTIQNGAEARELALKLNPIMATAPASASGLAKAMTLPKDMLNRYRAGAFNVAGATDDMYRVALVDGLMRREGMSLDEAAKVAEDAIYRREAVTAPIALIAEPFIPFYAVFHWAASRVPYYAAKNPVKAVYLATLASALQYIGDKIAGVAEEKGKALRKLLPEQMRDITIGGIRSPIQGLGFPNAVRIGTDKYGQPIYLDMSTWNIVNQFGAEIKDTALPYFPRALSPGGPLAVAAQVILNKELFTGRPIVERDQFDRPIRPAEQFDPTLQVGLTNFLARNLTPSLVRDVTGLATAAAGVPSPTRVQTDIPTKLLQTAGIKARPLPVAEQVRRMMAANEQSLRELSEEQARQRNRYVEGAKTNDQALMDDAMKQIQDYELLKQQRRQENTQRLMEVLPALGN